MASYLILIVDDDHSEHHILGEYLKLSGYEVMAAENGKKGLTLMEEEKPDLVLLDIQMPVMDGFETLGVMRESPEFKDIPVILLTFMDREHLKEKGKELGADDYIPKPINKADLLARVNTALQRAKRNSASNGTMEGSLSDIGLTDILQSMELGSKTASIFLNEIRGEIYVKDGSLMDARFGKFDGLSAMTRIFLKEKGSFSVRFNDLPQNISDDPVPLVSVLMGTLSDVDEIKDVISRLRADNRLIRVEKFDPEFPDLEIFRDLPPLKFIDMIVKMGGNPKDNLKILLMASKKGMLKIAK